MIHLKLLIFIRRYFYQNFLKSMSPLENRALAGLREL
jgi:hypothetical protein